jgi:hypothetical protein
MTTDVVLTEDELQLVGSARVRSEAPEFVLSGSKVRLEAADTKLVLPPGATSFIEKTETGFENLKQVPQDSTGHQAISVKDMQFMWNDHIVLRNLVLNIMIPAMEVMEQRIEDLIAQKKKGG